MDEIYFKQMRWWFDEFMASYQVEHYVELFPELNSRLSKFAIGIFLWNMKGLIDINNPDDVNKIHQILKILDQTSGYDFFGNTFNEADPDTVCGLIGMSPITPVEEGEIKFDYHVHEITSFQECQEYKEAASWSFIVSEELFKESVKNGNRFYSCENDEWWELPCIPGRLFPHDRFGYSLLGVEVSPENKIKSVTSRWNQYGGVAGKFLSPEDLRNIIGVTNFNKLFTESKEKSETE